MPKLHSQFWQLTHSFRFPNCTSISPVTNPVGILFLNLDRCLLHLIPIPHPPIGQSSSPVDSHHCSTDESRLSDRKTTNAPPYHITYHRRSKPRRLTFYRFISQASMYIFFLASTCFNYT
ncbi:hypothetical protein Hanom_Chr00s088287g01797681 [Helianthus anomalus]